VQIPNANVFAVFWRLLAELAWREYFDNPRTTSFGLEDFDLFPKGTTCFLASRVALEAEFADLQTLYADLRMANDDTPALRRLAARTRINISPQFSCIYEPRTTLSAFVRHSLHRGTVFLDGHGSPSSRFFPYVVAFFPLSAALMIASLRRPAVAPIVVASSAAAAAAYGVRAGRPRREVAVLAAVTPLYAIAHGAGMWRGLVEILRNRLR
jgi:hypothetical protein